MSRNQEKVPINEHVLQLSFETASQQSNPPVLVCLLCNARDELNLWPQMMSSTRFFGAFFLPDMLFIDCGFSGVCSLDLLWLKETLLLCP